MSTVITEGTVACRHVDRQRPADNRGMVFSALSAKQKQRNGVFCAVRTEML